MSYFFNFILITSLLAPVSWARAAVFEQLPDVFIKEVVVRPHPLHQGVEENVTVDVVLQNDGSETAILPAATTIRLVRKDTGVVIVDWTVGQMTQVLPGAPVTLSGFVIPSSAGLQKQVVRIPVLYKFDTTFLVNESRRENNSFESTLAVVATAPSDTRPPEMSDLKISDVGEGSAVVSWTTNEVASSEISWGFAENNLDNAMILPRLQDSLDHRLSLFNLRSGMRYFVRVRSRDGFNNFAEAPLLSFTTKTFGAVTLIALKVDDKLCSADGTNVRLKFSTDLPALARVQYGLDTRYGDEVQVNFLPLTDFETNLPLQPNTTYHYQIVVKGAGTGAQEFFSGDRVVQCAPPAKVREADLGRPLVEGLVVSDITKNSVRVSWQTDRPTKGRVEYGVTASYGELALSENLSRHHFLLIKNLQSGALYHYRIYTEDALLNVGVTPDQAWTTAAVEQQSAPLAVGAPISGDSGLKPVIASIPQLLVASARSSRDHSMATLGDGAVVVWEDTRYAAEVVGLRWFDAGGLPIGDASFLTAPPERTLDPEALAVGTRLLIAWQAGGRLEVTSLNKDGSGLIKEVVVQGLISDYRWVVGRDEPLLYWVSGNKIFAQRFDAQGKKIGEILALTEGVNPWLLQGQGGLALFWQKGSNILVQYINEQTWEFRDTPKYLSGVGLKSAAVDGDGFIVLWSEQNQVWYARLDQTGRVELGQRIIGEAASLGDLAPVMVMGGVYATAWSDHRTSREHFTFVRWRKEGVPDVLTMPLSSETVSRPRLAVLGDGYFVTYQTLVAYHQLYGFTVKQAVSQPTTNNIQPTTPTTNLADTLIISDISVSCPARQLATVKWQTNKPSDSRVEFGKEIYYGATAYGEGSTTEHEVKNIPVEPDVMYHYRIRTRTLAQPEVISEDRLLMCSSLPPVVGNIILGIVKPQPKAGQPLADEIDDKKAEMKKPETKKPEVKKLASKKVAPKPKVIKQPQPKVSQPEVVKPAPVPAVPVAPQTPSAPAKKKSWWKIW